MKLRRDMMGGDGEVEPYDVGQEVTIVSAPDASLVGQTGTIVSQHCGLYYAVDVGGAVSYQPDGNLGGDRPVDPEDATPAETPAPVVPPAAPPAQQAAALAALGGGSIAGQLEAAAIMQLGRDVMARTKAASPAAALQAVEVGLLAVAELPGLRARVTKLDVEAAAQAKAADLRARTDKVTATMRATGIGREAFFDVAVEKYVDKDGNEKEREKLTLKAVWMGGTIEQLDAQLGALTAGASPVVRPRITPPTPDGSDEIPPAVRRYAERKGRGNDVEYMKRLAANMPNSGAQPQES